jgi:hypothetical protein
VSVTRLVGFEASAVRYADCLPDDALADRLVELADVAAHGYASAHDLRELAACALTVVRRYEDDDETTLRIPRRRAARG